MTKISRLPLRTDVWKRILNLFVSTLADQTDKKQLSDFFNDFFSPTEKIMFAKRLAATVLLAKDHDYQHIHEILKMSPSTIAKLNLKIKYEGAGLKPVIGDIFKRENSQILWKEIEDLFDIPTKTNLKSPERFKRKLRRKQQIEEIKSEF